MTARAQNPITERQSDVLRFIVTFMRSHGMAPTLREIADGVDIKSTNGANDHLRALERKGFISRAGGGKARAIRLLSSGGQS